MRQRPLRERAQTATIVSQLQKELHAERKTTTMLQLELNCAKQHILQLETETRKNNIVIEGMPEMTGESTVLGPVLKLFNEQLELGIKSSDIDKAHRFGLSKCKITGNEVIGQRIMLEKDPLRIKRIGDRVLLKPNSEWHAKEDEVMRGTWRSISKMMFPWQPF